MHSDDVILDATRDLLVRGGTEAATTAAISSASGAPVGSLYHRFGSRTALFAEVWLRTAGRFQAGLTAAAGTATGIDRAVAVAGWTLDFAAGHPGDARLLLQARREDLLGDAGLPAGTRQALAELNRPVVELLRRLTVELYGTATPEHVERLTIAVVDVPYAIARRHLLRGSSPDAHRDLVATAVRALLTPSP